MLTTMRKIGNSRGVLIPAAFLATCQIGEQVDMQLQDGQIVIKPVPSSLRKGWFDGVDQTSSAGGASEQLESLEWQALSDTDDSEWVW
jgi:antitoxin MazE